MLNMEINAQLWQFFKDEGITLEEISQRTGYALGYLLNLFQGWVHFSDRAKFRMIKAFPETGEFLLQEGTNE